MLRSGDEGALFIIEDKSTLGARIGCGCALATCLLLVPTFFAMALLPPREVKVDCDRARGTCTWNARSLPVSKLTGAKLDRSKRGGRSWPVYTKTLQLELEGGELDGICTAPEDDPAAPGIVAHVAEVKAFVADPQAASLAFTCPEDVSTTGERIYYPISSLAFLAAAIFGLRIVTNRRFELDSAHKRVRLRGSFGSGIKKREAELSQLEGVELRNDLLVIKVKGGADFMLGPARTDADRQILATAKARLDAQLGAPPAA